MFLFFLRNGCAFSGVVIVNAERGGRKKKWKEEHLESGRNGGSGDDSCGDNGSSRPLARSLFRSFSCRRQEAFFEEKKNFFE